MKKTLFYVCVASFLAFSCTKTPDSLPVSGLWKVQSLDGVNVSKFNATFIISASDKKFAGTSGCNQFGASALSIDTTKNTLALDAIITTKIGCPNDLGKFELDYYTALRVIDTYKVSDKTLTISEKGKERLVLIK
jgi:heat shock protein HslJ